MDKIVYTYSEPDFDERMTAAQSHAQKILTGKVDTEEDLYLVLVMIIDREKKMGMFSDYYKNRTLDELMFEAEIVQGRISSAAELGNKVINNASTEAKEELGDWLEKQFDPVAMDKNNQFMKDAEEFMKTSNFKGENNG